MADSLKIKIDVDIEEALKKVKKLSEEAAKIKFSVGEKIAGKAQTKGIAVQEKRSEFQKTLDMNVYAEYSKALTEFQEMIKNLSKLINDQKVQLNPQTQKKAADGQIAMQKFREVQEKGRKYLEAQGINTEETKEVNFILIANTKELEKQEKIHDNIFQTLLKAQPLLLMAPDPANYPEVDPAKRGRGRPKGSKNKPKSTPSIQQNIGGLPESAFTGGMSPEMANVIAKETERLATEQKITEEKKKQTTEVVKQAEVLKKQPAAKNEPKVGKAYNINVFTQGLEQAKEAILQLEGFIPDKKVTQLYTQIDAIFKMMEDRPEQSLEEVNQLFVRIKQILADIEHARKSMQSGEISKIDPELYKQEQEALKVRADIQKNIDKLEKDLTKLEGKKDKDGKLPTAEIEKLKKEIEDLSKKLKEADMDVAIIGEDIESKLNPAMVNASAASLDLLGDAAKSNIAAYKKLVPPVKQVGQQIQETGAKSRKAASDFGMAAKNVFSYGLAFNMLRRIYRETINTIKELDHALTEMAIVTTMNRKEAWTLIPAMQELAKETGFTTTEISKLTTEYLKQGRSLTESIKLAEAAAKAARIAGISASESVSYLTAAINGFSLAAEDAMIVSDKFAALAAASATDYEELAVGLSKFASQANLAGLSMDFALGLLAKGVETTREAPESIGTALKTVLARMRELTDLGKTLEDGMSLNRVETALKQVGIQLRDTNGQFRDMEQVFIDIGNRWDTFNKNQQASIAVSLAGTRQQSRLISMFQDFDRTLELVDISQESAGATAAQHAEYMQSMSAAMTNLQNSYQKFITTISDSELIIDIIKGLSNAITWTADALANMSESGKTLMIILGSILIAMRAQTIATKLLGLSSIFAARGIMQNNTQLVINEGLTKSGAIAKFGLVNGLFAHAAAQRVSTGAITLDNAITKKQIALKLLANAAIAAGVLAVVALGYGIYKLIEAQKQQLKTVQEVNEEYQIFRYEMTQANKSVRELAKEIERLNSVKIKTEDDIKAIEALTEKLKEIKEISFSYDPVTGLVNLDDAKKKLDDYSNVQKEAIRESYRLAANYVSSNYQQSIQPWTDQLKLNSGSIEYYENLLKNPEDQNDYNKEMLSSYKKARTDILNDIEKIRAEFDSEEFNVVSDYFANQFGFLEDGNITQEQSKIITEYYEQLLTNPELQDKILNQEATLEEIFNDYLPEARNFFHDTNSLIEQINNAGENQATVFLDLTKNLDKSSASFQILSQQFPILAYMAEIFKDFKEVPNIFENMSINPEQINKMSEVTEKLGLSLDKIFVDTAKRKESIMLNNEGIDSTMAQSLAYIELAKTVEDVELKMILYGLAASKTTQEAAQDLDLFNSSIKNITESQKKMMSGEMTSSEIYDFAQNAPELFQNQELFERFINGENVTLDLINERLNKTMALRQNLLSVEAQMSEIGTDDPKYASLLAEKNTILLLLQYKGELANVTKEQYLFNNALESYNKITAAGITSSERNIELFNLMSEASAQQIRESSAEIDRIQRASAKEFGENYIQIIDGVATISLEALENLESDQLSILQDYTDAVQIELDKQFENFKTLRDKEIEIAKEANEKKKAIYEKYFANLDRMEQKREQKTSREELVKQLQRLETATDAESRKKAKELRQELSELDIQIQKDAEKQSREDLMNSLDQEMEALEEKWNKIGEDFIDAMATGGAAAGQAMINSLVAARVIGSSNAGSNSGNNVYTPEVPSPTISDFAGSGIGTTQTDLEGVGTFDPTEEDDEEAWKQSFKNFLRHIWTNNWKYAPISYDVWKAKMISSRLTPDNLKTSEDFNSIYWWNDKKYMKNENMPNDKQEEWGNNFYDWFSEKAYENFGINPYKQGGIVDYTGLAMVHGSSSKPEAFLNSNQTEMFSNLTKALAKISIEGGNSESIVIENITIQTQQLNNKQDFNSAGKTLADAFNSAISKRGIGVNTKR